ncbi:putative ORfan [Saudi moumouvirus]|uniref:Uncharacterized protein n=1 Tax=Moumouvirus sp. 'Monve' TaxID=1128131 RepID=H2EFA4_9VIRU|nr:hypothetical protein mv_L967 [Moumouvirus Monve]AQN68011.1 putative ORfan [Saudi moumouvirus]
MSKINDFYVFHDLDICITYALASQDVNLMKKLAEKINLNMEAKRLDTQFDEVLQYLDQECDDVIEKLLRN